MRMMMIAAALAATATQAGATVQTPLAAGGSEFLFAFSNGNPNVTGILTTGFTQDLGLTRAEFDFGQSYAFVLDTSFNVFLDPSEYVTDFNDCTGDNGLICSTVPTADNGWFSEDLVWGVLAGAADVPGNSWMLSTWTPFANNYDDGTGNPVLPDEGFGDPVARAALQLHEQMEPNAADIGAERRQLNELPGHAGNLDGSQLVEINGNDIQLDNGVNVPDPTTYFGSALDNFMAAHFFRGQDYGTYFVPAATPDEVVSMYLFDEGFDQNGVIAGKREADGKAIGTWWLDFHGIDIDAGGNISGNVVLRYDAAAVGEPIALLLFGTALGGLGALRRRSA